jgi:hypothetical protein
MSGHIPDVSFVHARTYLSSMPRQLHDLMSRHSDVMVPYTAILAPTRQGMSEPAHTRYSCRMSRHRPHLLAFFHIPDLHVSRIESDGEVAPIGRPRDGCDWYLSGSLVSCAQERTHVPSPSEVTPPVSASHTYAMSPSAIATRLAELQSMRLR